MGAYLARGPWNNDISSWCQVATGPRAWDPGMPIPCMGQGSGAVRGTGRVDNGCVMGGYGMGSIWGSRVLGPGTGLYWLLGSDYG